MTGQDTMARTIGDWEAMNGAYLARGLAWMHDRLSSEPAEAPAADRWWESPRFDDAGAIPALELLGDRVGMSRFERLVLMLVAATELDPSHGVAVRAGQRQPGRRVPDPRARPLDPARRFLGRRVAPAAAAVLAAWSSSTTRAPRP